jgi:hypothetical protein
VPPRSGRAAGRKNGEPGNAKHRPIDLIKKNRGQYVADCLTILRAYMAAKQPSKLPALASYEAWSDTVRSALCWLGCADPVLSMEQSKAEDPESEALLTTMWAWRNAFGIGPVNAKALRDVINFCDENRLQPNGSKKYLHPELRSAVLAAMPPLYRLTPDVTALGRWLRSFKGRRCEKMRFVNEPATGSTPTQWWIATDDNNPFKVDPGLDNLPETEPGEDNGAE